MPQRIAATQHKLQRTTHLVAAAMLLAYLYLPHRDAVELVVRVLIAPVLTLSGIAMCQTPRLRNLRKRALLDRPSTA